MTAEQIATLQENIDKGVPFSLSLFHAVCGEIPTLELARQVRDKEIPEPWRSEIYNRLGPATWQALEQQWFVDRIEKRLERIEKALGIHGPI